MPFDSNVFHLPGLLARQRDGIVRGKTDSFLWLCLAVCACMPCGALCPPPQPLHSDDADRLWDPPKLLARRCMAPFHVVPVSSYFSRVNRRSLSISRCHRACSLSWSWCRGCVQACLSLSLNKLCAYPLLFSTCRLHQQMQTSAPPTVTAGSHGPRFQVRPKSKITNNIWMPFCYSKTPTVTQESQTIFTVAL
jgi:hypothetical protein